MPEKSIAERLQVKGIRTLAVVGAPLDIDRKLGASKVRSDAAKADVVLLFVPDRARLDSTLPATLKRSSKEAIFWIAYPKLTSELAGDLSRDVIRALVSGHQLDTVSQIAIDETWSALRLKRL